MLKQLGVEARLGETVTLTYCVDGKQITDSFTLVGFWEGDKLMQSSQAWLSRGYVEKQLSDFTPEYGISAVGTMSADINLSNSFNIEGKLRQIITDSGYSPDEISYGINWAYIGNNGGVDAQTVLVAVIAVRIGSASCRERGEAIA